MKSFVVIQLKMTYFKRALIHTNPDIKYVHLNLNDPYTKKSWYQIRILES